MEVICIESEAFYQLVNHVIEKLTIINKVEADKWISGKEAMRMLRIKSKSTLQKLRDTGAIRFSQPEKKLILYDVSSIDEYLRKSAQDAF
ncbi:DNA-binding protein [Segetibacter sp. 3557_3]|uniref:helix-turn-helix domain-containing protein n=1 Tax=Segetibacter sp. 3557_3 TaxID=2547429 RepID=UPI0010586FF0|nr:helix-turn-helix domain-containing protein [Segetibacter sp. 3557_3]TDH20058.1 DNA-binding protein [Segetibacter sp. 3557_3]